MAGPDPTEPADAPASAPGDDTGTAPAGDGGPVRRSGSPTVVPDPDASAPPARPVPSSPEVSARMSRQAVRDTAQEVAVRRLLYAAGHRYRLHRPVPGLPRRKIDIAFPGARVAVFLDGCFWHGCPEHATSPKSNSEWWRRKLDGNKARDLQTGQALTEAGWTVLRFWEHEAAEDIAASVAAVVLACREDD